MVYFMFNKDYLASTCRGVMNRERFCTRDKDSCTFRIHGRVKFGLKSGLVYLQENPMGFCQYMCFDATILPRYKWEDWLEIYKSVKMEEMFTLTSKNLKHK